MPRPRIGVVIPNPLFTQLFSPDAQRRLASLGEVVAFRGFPGHPGDAAPTPDQAADLLRGCAIGVSSWGTPHPGTPGLLARLPDLRLWVHAAGTVKAMVTPETESRGLIVASCAQAIAQDVAEYTIAQIVLGLRRMIPNALGNRHTIAPRDGRAMTESTVGIVAASHVGRATLALLRHFAGKRLLYDPFVTADQAAELGAEKVDDLTELCRRSHAVSLHTPALPATRHIMGAAQFQAMPDDGAFINTARGSCVDEAALIAELRKGRLVAYLDVSDPEPAPLDSPLRTLPNVFYTTHIAGARSARIGDHAVSDIEAYLTGGRPKLAVTLDMLDRIA